MDPLKQQVERKLIADILVDKCAHAPNLIFRDAWCTQERVIRFTTPYFRALFSVEPGEKGKWKTGDAVMFEVENDPAGFIVSCCYDASALIRSQKRNTTRLFNALGMAEADSAVLKTWDLTPVAGDSGKLMDAFDGLLSKEIPAFERDLEDKLVKAKTEPAVMTEGKAITVRLTKYERNRKAREACIAAHGTACSVCGFDFGKVYGPDFAGMIEVHHLIPISEIGEEYVVNPVKDLAPVCPNCHAALHSKKDGVYTIEELKGLLR